ncbi:MAG: antiviral reverse transcriptase Drt3b, partial [Betaproteobacteria bacterium]
MSSHRRKNQINKKDYDRVLITETLPYETPIIFSNEGLYERIVKIETAPKILQTLLRCLVFGEGEAKTHSSIPYLYKIRKDSREFRRLALIHPRSQWKMREFYQKYQDLIVYHCSHSPASIRSPKKVAGSFYFKGVMENLKQYKDESISHFSLEELIKHSPTYFSYRGYDRLYKFFESKDYFELEKRHQVMLTLDVSKCFDSIYTHTMSWAIKDKEFTKAHVSVSATFAQEFDELMQHANHRETNGIVIGPEISRIFAEIIFQEVDTVTIRKLKKEKLEFGEHYAFRRYVDDVFIFCGSEGDAQKVYNCYSDVLLTFNLHANVSKSKTLRRPFVTTKSRLIQAASLEINRFVEKFLELVDGGEVLKPKRIRSGWRLTRSVVASIKSLCSSNQSNYDEVAPYLIAVLSELIKKIASIQAVEDSEDRQLEYRDALLVLLDVLYFLYEVSPSVGSSYKLCTAVILTIRFSRKHIPLIESTLAQRVYELTAGLLAGRSLGGGFNAIDGFLPLEVLNVVLTLRELGEDYLMPEPLLKELFLRAPIHSYFGIISYLF